MEITRRPTADFLEVARVLLLLQGSILVATTIEALVWGLAFAGAPGTTVVLSGAAAVTALAASVRLRADRRWTRRLVYVVEGLTMVTLALDMVLATLITGAVPPAVALLTRFVLPVGVIAILRREVRP